MTRNLHDSSMELLTESEQALARELAAVRRLLHLALEQLHETARQLDCQREQPHLVLAEYWDPRGTILREDWRAA